MVRHAACGASIGIAMAPGDGNDGVTLMKNADLALYRAKHEGKATYHFFEPGLDDAARRRRQLEIDLRSAIHEGEFELNFQPLYSLVEKRLTGFEALIRWNHPDPRTRQSGGVYCARRRNGADHSHRRMGDPRSLPPCQHLA